MRIDSRDLLGLPVLTESGERLGKVLSFDIDVESHAIVQYHVGPRNWPRRESYAIAPAQVVAITAEQLVVSDNAVRARVAAPQRSIVPIHGGNPVVTRDR